MNAQTSRAHDEICALINDRLSTKSPAERIALIEALTASLHLYMEETKMQRPKADVPPPKPRWVR